MTHPRSHSWEMVIESGLEPRAAWQQATVITSTLFCAEIMGGNDSVPGLARGDFSKTSSYCCHELH